MFQMSKQLFNQCWYLIAPQIDNGIVSRSPDNGKTPTPLQSAEAEAGYVLGVAMGYAQSARVQASRAGQPRASISGWPAEACGGLNWPASISASPRCATGYDKNPNDCLPTNRRPSNQFCWESMGATTTGNCNAQETS